MRLGNKGQSTTAIMGLIVFAVLLMILSKVFSSVENSFTVASSTSEAAYAKGNASNNTWASVQLSTVGPIVMGAVVILGIVGLLYRAR